MVDGKWTVMHVWESREACDRFREGRLFPAIQKVSGMDPASGPQVTITEYAVHNYEKPYRPTVPSASAAPRTSSSTMVAAGRTSSTMPALWPA